MGKIKVHDRDFEVMIPAERIAKAVRSVAAELNADYKSEDKVIILGILNGSFIFLSDLVRELDFAPEVCFVKFSSYEGCNSTGCVKELIGLNKSLAGRNVLIVEDIVDTGNSIRHILAKLECYDPASVEVCTLFFKPTAYRGEAEIKYKTMEIGDEFIVGYGLDYNELGREYKDIYVTK